MRKAHNAKKHTLITILIIAAAIAAVATACFFINNLSYEQGIKAGKEAQKSETAEEIKALGNAVKEKSAATKEITEKLALAATETTELTEDGIKSQLDAIKGLVETTTNEAAKTALSEYQKAWQTFQEVYTSKDNEKIKSAFETLKTTTNEIAQKLKSAYDQKITDALERL